MIFHSSILFSTFFESSKKGGGGGGLSNGVLLREAIERRTPRPLASEEERLQFRKSAHSPCS